ncbi:hybrid sensor histidine kinase/response regulator [Pseudomonas sediminis]|uniref:hybrid sensor histidine kinase/response regulator n=1 Tax=Pseudomonas sediminis TaxID=1691904 RepID=UPI00244B895D|nr:hybrid sensor histidine kinase/response regulator [Pseudomonas sediminis]MDG9760359.1 hybrid sensor histidine kinase/response regulator [Pseudomonas sediminis]
MSGTASVSYDTERAQAGVRMIFMSVAACYIVILYHFSLIDPGLVWKIFVLECVFSVVATLIWFDIRRRPGNYRGRRLITMLTDYAGITVVLTYGGAAMLPVYAILIWVTIGYGLRYGSGYLLLATLMALLSLTVTACTSEYWQSQPYLIVTLLLTTLMAPAYMHALLKRSRLAAEAEQAATRAKSQFLAQASHDLRQPIHSISLFTACLRDSSLDTEQRQLVENIDKSLHSVARLFRTILDMYSLDSGKVVPQMEPLELRSLLQQLIQQNAEVARWAGVEMRLRCPPLHVRADPVLLTTMLQNLLSNALKYAPGKPLLIACRRRGTGLAIEVYDKGRGIAAGHLDSIFEEFYRVRQERDSDVEGMGLGLAIVRRLGALMEMRVHVRSVETRGTRAVIDGQRVAAPSEMPSARRSNLQSPRMLEGLRVCLIEDDQNVLLATATLLKKWGCEVATFSTLPDVSTPFDLVVTDFDLGTEASGADCIQHVRRSSGRNVPAIIMTGHDIRRVQEQVGDSDIPILSKPVQPAELRSLLVALKLKAA